MYVKYTYMQYVFLLHVFISDSLLYFFELFVKAFTTANTSKDISILIRIC